jgi:hypothetical protein
MGMSLFTIAMAAEFYREGIAFNGLWPRTTVAKTDHNVAMYIKLGRCLLPDTAGSQPDAQL